MLQFIISSWRSGLRSRNVQGILLLGVFLVTVAYFSASFSPRQPKTVAMDVGFSGIRFCLVMLALVWVQELIGRELERRTVLFSVTYPLARGTYLLGRFFGLLGLLFLATAILGAFLLVTVYFAGRGYEQGFQVSIGWPYWATLFGLWCDAVLVAAFALMLSTFSSVSFLPLMLGAVFAIAGKSLGTVIDYLSRGADGDKSLLAAYAPLIDTIKWVLPDLSRLDLRLWPMYGLVPESVAVWFGGLMFVGYLLLMTSLAVIIFNRRDFLN